MAHSHVCDPLGTSFPKPTAVTLAACGASVTAVGFGKDVPNGSHTWERAILGYHLPDLTGVEIAARLPAGTPVLMVSGDPAAGAAHVHRQARRLVPAQTLRGRD